MKVTIAAPKRKVEKQIVLVPFEGRLTIQPHQYDVLKTMKKNRAINTAHVKKMKESVLRNGVLRNVIIVYDTTNEAYMIVDGQHLTEALKELNMRIDCVVKECETEADITQLMIDLNNTSKSWTLENYVNGWAESGVRSYRVLKTFANECNLPITTIMQAFTQKSRTETTKLVKEGKFDIANKVRGEELIGYIAECVTILPRTRQVTESLIKLMLKSESYNHKQMMKALKGLPKNFKMSQKESEIFAELVELYES